MQVQTFYFYIITGVALIGLEILLGTFYLCVIGVIFILSALLALVISNELIIGLISFGLSLIACYLLKYSKSQRSTTPRSMVQHVGQQVEVAEISAERLRVKYSGSYWDAKLAQKNRAEIKVGDILTITRYQNNEYEID